MKIKDILLMTVIALIPFSVSAADYQSATQQKFKTLDTNHDGVISQDEAKGDSMLVEEWSSVDTNKDGKIEESEFSAFEEEQEPGGMPSKSAY